MEIFEYESRKLIDKIMECRIQYLTSFSLDPDYVVIPWGYIRLLEPNPCYCAGYNHDTYYGMQIIESRACHNIDDVRVY